MTTLRLRFSPDGGLLICAGREEIQVWHLRDRRLLHQQPGTLIGLDSDGHTFLMETPDKTMQARLLFSGTTIPLETAVPDDFPLGQRCVTRRLQRSVDIVDVLAGRVIRSVPLDKLVDSPTSSAHFSAAALSADGAYLAIAVTGDSTWGEWAKGYCLRLDGKHYFTFSVNSAANRPFLQMSGDFLMVESAASQRTLIDMRTGAPLHVYHVADTRNAGQFFAVNPAETPPLIAFHTDRGRVTLAPPGLAGRDIVDPQAILDTAFMPDNQHIALLLENREVLFHDWRADHRKGALYLV